MSVPGTLAKFGDTPAARDQLGLGPLATVQTLVGLTVANQTLTVVNSGGRYYGSFLDTTNQTISTPGEVKAITFNTTSENNGVSIGSPTSKIVITNAGIYNIQFSIQFANTSSIENAYVWLKVNNTDEPKSSSIVGVTSSHGGVNGSLIMALNFVRTFNAGDYFQLMWSADATHVKIQTYTGLTSAPDAPAVILTVVQV
jgi:hypothetical protein